jgi:hypothetical protein
MSILDKRFLENITNEIGKINTYDKYREYLKTDIQHILRAELLSHIFGEDSEADSACFLLFKYEDKYIFIHIFVGTCSACGCFNHNCDYKPHILDAIQSSYVSTSKEDIEQYYFKCLAKDNCNKTGQNIYFIYPNDIYM